jgi:SAM-dependent methyltransferase
MSAPFEDRLKEIKDSKTLALLEMIARFAGGPPRDALVVGCGNGIEAGVIARTFGCRVIGIDIESEFALDHTGAAPAELRLMDARSMAFPDESFDLVYSFHALEHIPQHRRALAEMSRVLRIGKPYCVGTPNSQRLVGYLQAAEPLSNKIRYNLKDFRDRLQGRWSNELGAHAGFSAEELVADCAAAFGTGFDASNDYYLALYKKRVALVQCLIRSGLRRWLFPSVYAMGRRTLAASPAAAA